MKHEKKSIRSQLGHSALEFALIVPIFVMSLFSVVELGRYFWIQHAISSAAIEGARLAILNGPTDAEVVNYVQDLLTDSGVPGAPQVTISPRTPSQDVTVTVQTPFQFMIMPGFVEGLVQPNPLSHAAVMRHEP
ncbi:TadE/TadG family type IV pilus assembly protein [Desulfovibrio inopinatus]|uniref:TadE/TadG family type IV pilus assembly protein n=1 Tax=Desulfovibrio inopinatus TaxID=102109 RepID=UPI00040DE48A|nr:TadE/TadG family type IV pilus assembly protein [Desulfovibrio inopinatus]